MRVIATLQSGYSSDGFRPLGERRDRFGRLSLGLQHAETWADGLSTSTVLALIEFNAGLTSNKCLIPATMGMDHGTAHFHHRLGIRGKRGHKT